MSEERTHNELTGDSKRSELMVDMHCHATLKPFGHSFDHAGQHSADADQLHSIWYYDPPDPFNKLLNYLPPNLSRFRQSNFTAAIKGGVKVIGASLYPLEKGFFLNKLRHKLPAELLEGFITDISKKRIDHLQAMNNYFTDLEEEYDFLLQLHDKEVETDGLTCRYKIVKNFTELQQVINDESPSLAVVVNIEGVHSLNTGLAEYVEGWKLNKQQVFENLEKVKAWDYRPFYITLTHHFNNDICGHARSLEDTLEGVVDQSSRLNEGITPLGYELLDRILDKSSGRIQVDMKHMSVASRHDYYDYLERNWAADNIPLLVSHGAPNGKRDPVSNAVDFKETAPFLWENDINFFDVELLRIAKSEGLFCLQLDERHITNREALRDVRGNLKRSDIQYHHARLLWSNIQHFVEVLNAGNVFPWNHLAIGSDFDGGINPLNGFWTAEEMPDLREMLLKHASYYLESKACPIKKEFLIEPEEVVRKIFSQNALSFLERFFH